MNIICSIRSLCLFYHSSYHVVAIILFKMESYRKYHSSVSIPRIILAYRYRVSYLRITVRPYAMIRGTDAFETDESYNFWIAWFYLFERQSINAYIYDISAYSVLESNLYPIKKYL